MSSGKLITKTEPQSASYFYYISSHNGSEKQETGYSTKKKNKKIKNDGFVIPVL